MPTSTRSPYTRAAADAGVWLAAGLALGACGASAPHRPDSATGAARDDALAKLEQRAEAQASRMAELEARIALLEADAREWREEADAPKKSTETVRIGGDSPGERDEVVVEHVPLVRLHEAGGESGGPFVLPSRPPEVEARLPVVPLPGQRASKLLSSPDTRSDADARARYRSALGLVRAQKFDQAGEALAAFLDAYPAHALSDGATYWLGEVRYAQRRYDQALRQFQTVLSVFPDSGKRAGSLLKAGLCQKRLGDEAAARQYFQQLREQYPNSDAARIASREGSS